MKIIDLAAPTGWSRMAHVEIRVRACFDGQEYAIRQKAFGKNAHPNLLETDNTQVRPRKAAETNSGG